LGQRSTTPRRGDDKRMKKCGGGDAVYGLGLIGALIYFIQHAPNFWMGVLGVLKAIVWPAFVVYQLLSFLKIF
jgi:hypothetical protein